MGEINCHCTSSWPATQSLDDYGSIRTGYIAYRTRRSLEGTERRTRFHLQLTQFKVLVLIRDHTSVFEPGVKTVTSSIADRDQFGV